MTDNPIPLGDQSLPQHGDEEVITAGGDAGKTVGELRAEVFGEPGSNPTPPSIPSMPKFLREGRSLEEVRLEAIERIAGAKPTRGMRGHLLAFPEEYEAEGRVLQKLVNLIPLALEEEPLATDALICEAERIRARSAAQSRRAYGHRRGRANAKGAFGKRPSASKKKAAELTCFFCEKPFTPEETRYRIPSLGAPAFGQTGLVAHTRCIPNPGNPRSGGE